MPRRPASASATAAASPARPAPTTCTQPVLAAALITRRGATPARASAGSTRRRARQSRASPSAAEPRGWRGRSPPSRRADAWRDASIAPLPAPRPGNDLLRWQRRRGTPPAMRDAAGRPLGRYLEARADRGFREADRDAVERHPRPDRAEYWSPATPGRATLRLPGRHQRG